MKHTAEYQIWYLQMTAAEMLDGDLVTQYGR
jgi:hypothetical protein